MQVQRPPGSVSMLKPKWLDSEDVSKSGRETEEFKRFVHLEEISTMQDKRWISSPCLPCVTLRVPFCCTRSAFGGWACCCLGAPGGSAGPPVICTWEVAQCWDWKLEDFAEGHWGCKISATTECLIKFDTETLSGKFEVKLLMNYPNSSKNLMRELLRRYFECMWVRVNCI